MSTRVIAKHPRIIDQAEEARRDLGGHLQVEPYDLLALRMERALCEGLDDAADIGRIDQAIAKANALLRTGLVVQLLRYIGWVSENLAELGQAVRGVIVARSISDDLLLACRGLP